MAYGKVRTVKKKKAGGKSSGKAMHRMPNGKMMAGATHATRNRKKKKT